MLTAFRFRALATTFLLVACAGQARAHGGLRSSQPARDATLVAFPREIRLAFTESPELTFTTIALSGPDGAVQLGAVSRVIGERFTVAAPINGPLRAGVYTVTWRTAGADGHPVRGQFSFTIVPHADPSGGQSGAVRATVTPPGQPPAPVEHHSPESFPRGKAFDVDSPAFVAVRWLQYSALLVLIGALAFHYAVLGFLRRKQRPDSPMLPDARNRAATIGMWAVGVLLASAILRLFAQSVAMHGSSNALEPGLVAAMLRRTMWGWGWTVQVAGALVALAGFARARRAVGDEGTLRSRDGWGLAAAGGGAAAFSVALGGHAAAAPNLTTLAIVADGLHVIGASGWLGSLLFVLFAGIPAAMGLPEPERGPGVADLVNAFSPTALLFAGLTSVTGVFAAWLHLGAIPALWQTPYGQVLLLKLGILSVVAATGAYNWLRVKPSLGGMDGAKKIRRSATVELGVAVLVLVVTAILVAMPTAMDARAMSQMADSSSDPVTASAADTPAVAQDGMPDTHATGTVIDTPARDEDQHFLRDFVDHHVALTYLAHELMNRVPEGPLKEAALRVDMAQDSVQHRATSLLQGVYQDAHPPTPRAEDRAAADAILALPPTEASIAFERFVLAHRRRGNALIDDFLPRLVRREVTALAKSARRE